MSSSLPDTVSDSSIPPGPTGSPSLGRKLAALRAERHLTLREVALGCGLAESFLSKLERDKVNISVGNLGKIAGFYHVPIGYFFEASSARSHGIVTRAAEYPHLTRTNPAVQIQVLLPHHHSLDAVLVETPPNESESSHHMPCSGEEFTYVIRGKLRYWVANEEYLLETGDTISHRSDLEHRWENTGDEPTLAISVCLPGPNQYGTKTTGANSQAQSSDSSNGSDGHAREY